MRPGGRPWTDCTMPVRALICNKKLIKAEGEKDTAWRLTAWPGQWAVVPVLARAGTAETQEKVSKTERWRLQELST